MTDDSCGEMHLLVQADIDGELSPAQAARVAAHVDGCVGCAEVQDRLLSLRTHVRAVARHPAPDALRAAVRANIAGLLPPARRERRWLAEWARALRQVGVFAAGAAVAAGVVVALLPPRGGDLSDALVVSHIRALQPGHLMDVASTDQHMVKPWFDGRIDFAPPVKDFSAAGFPLAGGRLDYIGGRPAAVLVYRRREHVIDVYVWPAGAVAATAEHSGYNVLRWERDGMAFSAVSDLNGGELADFVRLWKRS